MRGQEEGRRERWEGGNERREETERNDRQREKKKMKHKMRRILTQNTFTLAENKERTNYIASSTIPHADDERKKKKKENEKRK